jgi:hypothetical protein
LTISRFGTGSVLRHPKTILSLVFLALVLAYTASVPNFDQPFISYALASAVIFLFVAHSSTRAWAAAILAALGFTICQAFFDQGAGAAAPSVSLYAGMLGRGGFLVLGWRAICAPPQESLSLRRILLIPIGIVSFVFASLVALNLTVMAHPRVLDSYLYMFDGSLGFQPSFMLGRLFLRYKPLADVALCAYLGLPFVIGLVCAGYLKYGSPWRLLGILASAGLLGYFLYFAFPATGPVYVAGASFPGSPHPFATLGQMHAHPITLPFRAPRNAIPSLHMAWALLLWFNCRPLSGISRGLAVIYVVLTVVATLGTGEHYLADLAVAVPFSVAVQALWTRAQNQARYRVLAGATGLTLAWLIALRYGTNFFLLSPAIPWGCILVSTIASLMLGRLLHRFE